MLVLWNKTNHHHQFIFIEIGESSAISRTAGFHIFL